MKPLRWRFTVIILSVLFSLYLLLPSILKWGANKEVPRIAHAEDPWWVHLLPSEVLKLGLDLMGGIHLVLGMDFNEINRDAITRIKNQLKDYVQEKALTQVTLEVTPESKLQISYPDDNTWKKVEKLIGNYFGSALDFQEQHANKAVLALSSTETLLAHQRGLDQALETLRNRIDEFGIAEPIIQRQGEEKILVQFPGVKDVGRLKEIISRVAKLTFQIERSGPEVPGGSPSFQELQAFVDQFLREKNIKLTSANPLPTYSHDLTLWLKGKIPSDTEIKFHKKVDIHTKEALYLPYLLTIEPVSTGEDLQNAYYTFNPSTEEPVVMFQLTPMGAQRFEKGTGENVGKMMAIVLDNNVYSAPRINQKIGGGRAEIQLGGQGRSDQDLQNEAKDIALVLRSGALPARLEFLEERTVGPSLGADAIRAGTISLLVGVGLVFLFMGFYYRMSGLIADLALVLNGIFIFAALAAFEGTLTLPGLAGVTLTLGIAVDANVLIFEHIREELRNGKALSLALSEGYARAFTAIFDSHVTAIIAAIVLLSFGYGPIRGFAITLLIGLTASLYTAVFVTRVIFDYLILYKRRTTISI